MEISKHLSQHVTDHYKRITKVGWKDIHPSERLVRWFEIAWIGQYKAISCIEYRRITNHVNFTKIYDPWWSLTLELSILEHDREPVDHHASITLDRFEYNQTIQQPRELVVDNIVTNQSGTNWPHVSSWKFGSRCQQNRSWCNLERVRLVN